MEESTCRHCGLPIRLLPGDLETTKGELIEPWTSGAIGTPVTFWCNERAKEDRKCFPAHQPVEAAPLSLDEMASNVRTWIDELGDAA